MPGMNATYRNAIGDHGATLVTHIALFTEVGAEITGGTYARLAVTWVASADGIIRPTANLTFNIPTGVTVGGWRGFSALTAGTNYGGKDLTNQAYPTGGTYTLLAASTSINHVTPV